MKTTATRATLFAAAIALMTAWGAAAIANPYLYGSSYYDYDYRYAPERLSRERRAGAELDNWIERGNATVTLSPAFDRGIRVAAWATGGMEPDNYEYGIASAVYLFDIPYGTRQIKIKIRYEGDGRAHDLNRDYAIAGRAWIRSDESGGDNLDEALQGDTFLLRSDRRSETLEIPADRYVNPEGLLELHIVADGANRIDIDYIEVETFTRELRPNVIRRHVPGYRYAPWNAYGYHSLYGSNFYFPTDYGYYLYWEFPVSDSVYIGINRRWRGYYNNYYSSRRYGYGRYDRYNVYRPAQTNRYRPVNRWTTQLNSVRGSYERGRNADVRSRDIGSVRQALSAYRTSPTPSTQIAGAYSEKRRSSVSTQRRSLTSGYSTGLKNRGAASTGSRSSTSPTRRSIDYSRYAPSSRSSDDSRTSSPYTRSRTYTPQEERTRPAASSSSRSSSSSSSKPRSSASSSSSSSGKSRGAASSSSSSDDDDDKKRR